MSMNWSNEDELIEEKKWVQIDQKVSTKWPKWERMDFSINWLKNELTSYPRRAVHCTHKTSTQTNNWSSSGVLKANRNNPVNIRLSSSKTIRIQRFEETYSLVGIHLIWAANSWDMCASEDTDQSAHSRVLFRIFAERSFGYLKMYSPASILRKSTSGRHRPVSYPDGPMTARYRFT